MPEERKTRRWTPLRRIVFPAVLLLALILLAGYLLLPLAAERFIVPAIMKTAGIREYALPVRVVSPFGVDLGPLRLGPEASPGLTVAAIRVRYHPAGLLRGRLARLTLDGVRIRLVQKPHGGFEIHGWPAVREKAEEDRPLPEKLPVAIDRVDVEQGEVLVQTGDRQILVPFEARLTPSPDMKALEGILHLEVQDQSMAVQGRVDLAGNRLSAQWQGQGLRLGELARLAGMAGLTALTGTGAVRGNLRGRLIPLEIEAAHLTLSHTPCRLIWDDIRLELSGDTPGEDLHLSVDNDGSGKWHVAAGPIRTAVSQGEGRFTVTGQLENGTEGRLAWHGRLAATVAPDLGEKSGLRTGWPLALETDARLSPEGRWQADLKVVESRPPESAQPKTAGSPSPWPSLTGFTLRAEGERSPFKADIRWRLSSLDWARGGLRLGLQDLEGTAHYQREGDTGQGTLSVALGTTTISAPDGAGRLGALRFTGQGEWGSGEPPALSGELAVQKGRLTLPAAEVEASGFSLRLPVTWPPPEKSKPGSFALASALWENRALGRVTGRLHQTAQGIAFEARHDNRLLAGLVVRARGRVGLGPEKRTPAAQIQWSAERPADAPPIALSDVLPNPPKVSVVFKGALFARGQAAYDGRLQGSFTAGVDAGRLQVDDQGAVVEGIATTLHMPDIRTLRSAPAQVLTFKAVSLGKVRAEKGRLDYQVEPGDVVFLENGRFQWCGGTVIVPATRFTAGKNDYNVTALCDRIKLDRLLEQLGMAKVEGGGAISGLIPVSLKDGRLRFDNAFLYSSPGEGGVIRVEGSEILTAGVPQGSSQYNQMELARYALKDYDYQWAKVTLNSEADDLLVKLQFDGKPAGPLPFVYDADAGGFVKTAPDKPGSIFQGIRLDVNVTLPLNRLLRYRELFKQLQQ